MQVVINRCLDWCMYVWSILYWCRWVYSLRRCFRMSESSYGMYCNRFQLTSNWHFEICWIDIRIDLFICTALCRASETFTNAGSSYNIADRYSCSYIRIRSFELGCTILHIINVNGLSGCWHLLTHLFECDNYSVVYKIYTIE